MSFAIDATVKSALEVYSEHGSAQWYIIFVLYNTNTSYIPLIHNYYIFGLIDLNHCQLVTVNGTWQCGCDHLLVLK